MSGSVRLSRLLYELEEAGFLCDDFPPYRKLWQGAVERRFPAHQVNGVWHFFRIPPASDAWDGRG